MSSRPWYLALATACVLLAALAGGWLLRDRSIPGDWAAAARLPRIRPDCTGTVIPPNIAPLDFAIEEPGVAYRVRIHAAGGESLDIASGDPSIVIPMKAWKALLERNRGGRIGIAVYVQDRDGPWTRFDTIEVSIAKENIDSHLVYRLLGPVFNAWGHLGIYHRNLETYEESPILQNASFEKGCVNCHCFAGGNRPESFSFHVRPPGDAAFAPGMIVVRDGQVARLPTPPRASPGRPGYTAWHPSAPLAAVSLGVAGQFMHGAGAEVREVYEMNSDLAIVDLKTGAMSSAKGIADPNRLETFPSWSPDGDYLYFCSAPLGKNVPALPPFANYDSVQFDLMRIRYDVATDTWGEPECLLPARKTGRSILEPRVSPDGRFLLFCMASHGAFPVLEADSDLYLMDLTRGGEFPYRPLTGANSPQADSWHCWSSNSRWIVYSSKRQNGLFARFYICYVDPEGRDHKPFVLPQKDPFFYDTYLKTYNVPELVTGPVTAGQHALVRAILSEAGDGGTSAPPAPNQRSPLASRPVGP